MMVAVVPMVDDHHNLGVCGLRKRYSEDQGEQAVHEDSHICVDGERLRQVVTDGRNMRQPLPQDAEPVSGHQTFI
jgi:hypothetical protein